ncbi:NAD(P) transhydrogenase beta subunit [Paraburkholderia xenovorans LB400]|uniref:NAD(P) transhydrogenase subunit beta n=1 Tax=Paraburkholderia xenovorans (strain LB400) TaxID=266265 RepID=Q13HL3_PARXL|nr:NAD(P)(+) transhydrogenase (Re/Si-specific) subunit beta [Paraburkholderia xenovorans]ABE36426.1 Putative NAD(P) transhydrogenase beta subunit [Paraburkholderia xenovorans LB400]AIP33984.1 NAD(P) transhydrogenase beta subunit [Paraburkholderia xenovorans LB400]
MLTLLPQLGIGIADLAAAFLFLYGLHRMSSPVTAPSGIFVAGIGMAVAVLASFLYAFGVDAAARPDLPVNLVLALVALAIGGGVAWWGGRKVAMTAMPQMVAIYNGMGGGAAGAIAAVELFGNKARGVTELVATLAGAFIGAVSLSGSLIAWAKLDGVINKPVRVKGQQVFNGLVLLATVAVGACIVVASLDQRALILAMPAWIYVFFGCALAVGILMTLPIGGADMPVVISIFNAFTGLAVGIEGYVLQNPALMIAGMVVGAAGMLLTLLMAKAMNRSVSNVVFTNFGEVASRKQGKIKGSLKPVQPGDAGIAMRYAASVIIVPGYGLAVSQGQGKLFEFVKLLQAGGVSVKFAVHPVAGRMPGQMDVLLAEAGVPYDMIFQLEDINEQFASTDVALVIGANDVVNPAARTDKSSVIFGMPILDADKAKQVFVIKRGEGNGYAGIVNALFYADTCSMVYGDAQGVLVKMIEAVRGLGLPAVA